MASEDVIELGSSDDEAEPAPKKVKPSSKPKPKLNAMVHIPSNLHGVTIKPSTAKTNKKTTMPIIPGIEGKPITVTKVNPRNQFANKAKVNGKPSVNIAPLKKNVCVPLVKPIRIGSSPKVGVNPITLMNKLNNSQVMINKVPSSPKEFKHPIKFMQNPKCLIRVQSPRTLNTLPPSITIKRAGVGPQLNKMTVKRPANATITNVRKKQKVAPKGTVGDVLTVELDDDEGSTTTAMSSSPQWYLRPEQQNDPLEMETANNEEPDTSKYIEITIEDSPVKPTSNKRTCEVGAELAITIEDSPVKLIQPKPRTSAHSDEEETPETSEPPHSKKKLDYPKETETNVVTEAIEIEIEPIKNDDITKEGGNENQEEPVFVNEPILIEDTPVKKSPNISTSTPKKDHNIPKTKVQEPKLETEKVNPTEPGEFHPAYQSFIDICLKLEDSDDMKKIVEKKIKGYYRQVPKEYTESEEFIDMVTSKIISIKAGPEKMYLYIKDIVDELNLQRKMTKTQTLTTIETKSTEPDKFPFGEESEYDSKRQRQIRKLEKTLKKLHRAIQKLEEQEVDFDDDEDSVYLLTERYKERMVRVHAKFCQLTNTKMPSEPRLQIDARAGMPSGPAKRLEKWVNKKVPIGTPLTFPDFHDVLRCVREANDEDKLGWNEADIMEEARDLFTRCGRKLQRRRQENEWRLAASRIAVDIDPAEQSEDLKNKLEDNKKVATKKETEVFNKYADRQSQLKLEAVEIGDKEAEESPVESEDDEPVDESSSALGDKEKRKERIRRIINEKSKKNTDEGEPKKSQEEESGDVVMSEAKNDEQNENMEIDASASKEEGNKSNEEPEKVDTVHSVSDESNEVESEVDELHLLQKLHSGNEINSSTLESSDTDTPIDISDTIQSSSDNKGKQAGDVISIENSSYSESEVNKDSNTSKEHDVGLKKIAEKLIHETVVEKVEAESPKKRTDQTNNDEYNDSVENILLASSDDELEENKNAENASPSSDEPSVNLKDDAISIGDTVVAGVDELNNETNTQNKNVDKDLSELKGAQNDDSSQEILFIPQEDKQEESLNGAENVADSQEAQNDDSSQEILFVSQEDKQEVSLNGAENVADSQEAQNDDSSQEIVFVSQGDKEPSLSPLNSEANSNENTNSARLSAVQAMEVCDESEESKETEFINTTNEVVDSVSKPNANSEETMEIIDVREAETENASSDTDKEQQDCGKDNLPESNDLTKSLDDKNYEDKTKSTSNDKQESSTGNDKQETNTGNDKQETSTGNDKQETSAGNDKQETNISIDQQEASTRDKQETSTHNDKQEISTGNDKQETSTGNDKQETSIGNDQQETSTDNEKQETVDILISEIQNLEPIEPLEVPASILQNNEQLLNGTDSHDIL